MLVTMLPLFPLVCVAYFILYACAFSIPLSHLAAQRLLQTSIQAEKTDLGPQSSLDAWIDQEEKIALQKLLDNVAPGGKNTKGAAPGTVIASPSHDSPDYYFQWIRDAGITTATLVNLYSQNSTSTFSSDTLLPILEAYAHISRRIQRTSNPSGSFSDLSGLGEPKFHVDGTPFTGSWGRPQRDGPALRALTLMGYIRAFNSSHPALWVESSMNPYADLYDARLPAESIVKADLEYVSRYWRESGFDLWEEVEGLHFFTAMVQLRALREGADVANAFADHGAARWYTSQAAQLEDLLPRFWSEEKGHLVSTLHTPRSGLDCGVLLGAIHGSSATSRASPFPPHSDEILLTLLGLVRDQRDRFPINSVHRADDDSANVLAAGVGIGRYPEDVYTGYGTAPAGGNPWFLCTASAAEILFATAAHLRATQTLHVTARGAPFWHALLAPDNDAVRPGGTYGADSPVYQAALAGLQVAGDAFLARMRTHVDGEGAMSEQFDRVDGFERGARDLTWSYGAFLQAVGARRRMLEGSAA